MRKENNDGVMRSREQYAQLEEMLDRITGKKNGNR